MGSIPGWLVGSTVTLAGGALLYVARELWKRWRGRIVEHLDKALRRQVARFDRRYREFMLSSLRFIDVKGLATVGFYTPELDEVFVDVSLAYRAPHQIPEGVLTQPPAEVTDRRSINEFLDHEKPVVLAMIGAPGSGKTTLLRHTARMVCRQPQGRRRTVPILLYLRDHIAKIVQDPHIPLQVLVLDALGRMSRAEPPDWFERRLRNGDCVVLLDGLDEVAVHSDRMHVANWVAGQTRQFPRNDFVITSRPQGYRSAPIDGAVVVQVRSFTDEQVTKFVQNWYRAIEQRATGESDEGVLLRAREAADDLLKRLDANPALYDLTVNPLLLTMIANVHRFRGALPGSRYDLYGEICQVMLSRRQEAKNLPVELSGDRKEALLRGLAFTMMRRRLRDLSRADIHEIVEPALRRLSTRLTEAGLLADLSSNGLLIEREADLFAFAHLTFQEYLAATHIRDKALTQTLVASVSDTWWRETTQLYATRSDADPLVAACLDSGSVAALSLAFDVADQCGELDPKLRGRLEDLLHSTGDDPARKQLAIDVAIARHLRDQTRTSGGGRVYTKPVNRTIYELFRADTGVPLPDDARVHGPVVGVHGSDAAAFVQWINNIAAGEQRYRLPNRDEITDPSVKRALGRPPTLSVWLEPSGESGQPELWTPAGTPHPNRVDAELVGSYVRADFEHSMETIARMLSFPQLDIRADFDAVIGLRPLVNASIKAQENGPITVGWPGQLTTALLDVAHIAGMRLVISLDALADSLRKGREHRPGLSGAAPLTWPYQLADRLETMALPVVTRQKPLTASTATAVRIAALCLAGEAYEQGASRAGDSYREVAAGITLMERRADGKARVTETIMLAMA